MQQLTSHANMTSIAVKCFNMAPQLRLTFSSPDVDLRHMLTKYGAIFIIFVSERLFMVVVPIYIPFYQEFKYYNRYYN